MEEILLWSLYVAACLARKQQAILKSSNPYVRRPYSRGVGHLFDFSDGIAAVAGRLRELGCLP